MISMHDDEAMVDGAEIFVKKAFLKSYGLIFIKTCNLFQGQGAYTSVPSKTNTQQRLERSEARLSWGGFFE